jgi:3-oxoacyl-[acyl-carrier protein] reductase
MDLTLNERHALVCGASQGIGLAAATELAELGANVTLLARSADKLTAAAAGLPRVHASQRHAWRSVDMLDTKQLQATAAAIAVTQPVHILINNTGGPPAGNAQNATIEAFETAFRQHLLANQTLLQTLLPAMRAGGYGRIVNVISTSVKEPIAGLGVSNTIRAAVASWAKTLASELATAGITVNNVLPGYTRTQRLEQILAERSRATGKSEADIAAGMLATVPAGRFAEAAEIAAAVAFLCSPAAGYVNGVNLPVDGGRTKSL